jgi:hypothetical protein
MVWQFNGDLILPSFSPSLLNTCEMHPDSSRRRCHLHMTLGKINYGADCSHSLAGESVDVPDWETRDNCLRRG